MRETKPIFDKRRAKEIIEKGRRAKWWQRQGSRSRGFTYVDRNERQIRNKPDLERIAGLVIPPAWSCVRISPSTGGRIQAVGMDTTGRVQYLYHPKFAEAQQRKKFAKIERFGKYLPKLRAITNNDIALEGFPREKVLAIMMRLINSLYFRVGAEDSARHYKTYGITTLQNKHLIIGRQGKLVFDFVGKSHIQHRSVLVDQELALLMKDLKELGPKRKLFTYLDQESKPRPVKPSEINAYIKAATSPEFSSKDFRTWGATLLAAIELAEVGSAENKSDAKKNIVRVVKKVSEKLGNTPAVCRGSYIHPSILSSYENGVTLDEFRPRNARNIKRLESEFEPEEKALLKFFSNGDRRA